MITSNSNFDRDKEKNEKSELDGDLKTLMLSIRDKYDDLSRNTIGDIRRSVDEGPNKWEPIIKDSSNTGATFTYDHQVGFVVRNGIMVDVFFDVKWTGSSAVVSGNMYLELPYKVAIIDQKPFIGVLQPSIFAYSGGTDCVINAISDTYRGEIWNTGDGFTSANQQSASVGHLIGNIRYVSQGIERG